VLGRELFDRVESPARDSSCFNHFTSRETTDDCDRGVVETPFGVLNSVGSTASGIVASGVDGRLEQLDRSAPFAGARLVDELLGAHGDRDVLRDRT